MSSELLVVHDGHSIAGTFREDVRGKRTFAYEDPWRQAHDSIALSLSLPMARREHVTDAVDCWLWGLLPDNELVLERWSRAFQVSAGNPFRLLSHVGEDCSGAFQLVTPANLSRVVSAPGRIDWLSEADVAARLAAVRADPSRTRMASDTGQFSLAGAQPKIALHRDGDRWGVPSGRVPTTHILKPPTGAFDGLAENEHFCLRLAAELGLPVAFSEVRRFGDEPCIVVERFDRLAAPSVGRASRVVARLHQEDLCQALGIHPARKYQNDGGPTPLAIVEVIRGASTRAQDDVLTFVDALVLSWLTGGTDAHAKNYALLLGRHGQARLAPLYDLASVLPYPQIDVRRAKLAMSIGGEYRLHAISARHFRKLAVALRLDAEAVVERVRSLVRRTPDAVADVEAALRRTGIGHPIVDELASRLIARAATCAAALGR